MTSDERAIVYLSAYHAKLWLGIIVSSGHDSDALLC